MFNKFLSGLVLLCFSTMVMATEYRVMYPFGVGSSTDAIARKIADVFNQNTGDVLVIENLPGANGLVGTEKWKNNKSLDIYVTSGTCQIFEPALKNDLPYNDNDFDYIIHITTLVGVWVTRPDTGIKTPNDLIKRMPAFVGSYSINWNQNVWVLAKEKNLKVQMVPYKGINETVQGLLAKDTDLIVVGNTANIMGLVKAGKLHIVGTTYQEDYVQDGIKLLSVPKRTRLPGSTGLFGLALRPGMDPTTAAYLKRELWRAITSPEIKNFLESLGYIIDSTNDPKQIVQHFSNERARVKKYAVNQ